MAGGKGSESTLRIKTPVLPPGAIRLRIVSGPDSGQETLVLPDMKRVTLGTRPESEVPLTDPTVSRRHAEIVVENDRYLLRDLGSTNGTYVDNVRVEQAYVEPDSVIRVGRSEIRLLTSEVSDTASGFEGLYGQGPVMKQVFELIEKVAASPLIVLIAGETGTGKELVARAIHRRSSRSAGPFTVVDCSAIPENLMESELFGHERGAFTGASSSRKGAFELADGGTLFLDEVGELGPQLQPKLLRVLERQEIKRVGASRPTQVDVRVLAATNRNLKKEVKEGAFREDLYYRLSVLEVSLPRLRDRQDDIPLLVGHFMKQSVAGSNKRISPAAMELLTSYEWPGNVRQLRNVIERALLMCEGNEILTEVLRPLLPAPVSSNTGAFPREASLTDIEKKAIESALRASRGNKTAAAKRLGIAYSTLYEKIKKYGL